MASENIIDWFSKQEPSTKSSLIQASVGVGIFILGGIAKGLYDKYMLHLKMRKEYNFAQKKKIKEGLATTKTPLIKASEELNYRLWNLKDNINEGWHNIEESIWNEGDKYYLRSTVYRFLVFLHGTLKAESSIYNFDLEQADSEDKVYLKYIKTLKHFFCEASLLRGLGYDHSDCSHHFYKDDLQKFTRYIENKGGYISYNEFEKKFKLNHLDIKLVVNYFVNIKSEPGNYNYNVIKAFHLFLILFLNKFGLDYHYTQKAKIEELVNKYKDLKIKDKYYDFLKRNKVTDESHIIIESLLLSDKFADKENAILRNTMIKIKKFVFFWLDEPFPIV